MLLQGVDRREYAVGYALAGTVFVAPVVGPVCLVFIVITGYYIQVFVFGDVDLYIERLVEESVGDVEVLGVARNDL